ncbi:MAG TPA: pilus assembly protein TadG, partial [Brevundimonas sp.]|nr:pilus assembly protein TadG [Brevundimonas sp.]
MFRNPYGQLTWFEASSCVAERTGSQAYTDAVTNAAARAQFNYSGTSGNRCPSDVIVPLSSDREGLKAAIDDFAVAGS